MLTTAISKEVGFPTLTSGLPVIQTQSLRNAPTSQFRSDILGD
jgi:hypothetical protein